MGITPKQFSFDPRVVYDSGSGRWFAGLTIMDYAGDGQFSFQEDIYNWEEAVPVLEEWAAIR